MKLKSKVAHLDSTSIHVDGKYANDYKTDEYESVITLTKGYSRDHRQELNQAIINLIIDQATKIPLAMLAASGNTSDKCEFAKIIKEFSKRLIFFHDISFFIADSALYSSEGISMISKDVKWITGVPETLLEAKTLINNASVEDMTEINENYKYSVHTSNYANVNQRRILVFSKQAYAMELHTLDKNMLKNGEREAALFYKLCNKVFACEPDAIKALNEFKKTLKHICIENETFSTEQKYGKRGRPKSEEKAGITNVKIRGQFLLH